ncbi:MULTISPECIES: hypothetical protein [unclassified Endozoicomonas]|uniref:hypothetical protein n=1 Tax=unclassified Endozoicomonas TaxID=2644528 RepID=UPI003BB516A8
MNGMNQFKPLPPVTTQPQPEGCRISGYTLNCNARVKKDAATTVGLIAGSTALASVIGGALSSCKPAVVIATGLPVCAAATIASAFCCICKDECPCFKPLPDRQVEHVKPGYLADEEQHIAPGAEKR